MLICFCDVPKRHGFNLILQNPFFILAHTKFAWLILCPTPSVLLVSNPSDLPHHTFDAMILNAFPVRCAGFQFKKITHGSFKVFDSLFYHSPHFNPHH